MVSAWNRSLPRKAFLPHQSPVLLADSFPSALMNPPSKRVSPPQESEVRGVGPPPSPGDYVGLRAHAVLTLGSLVVSPLPGGLWPRPEPQTRRYSLACLASPWAAHSCCRHVSNRPPCHLQAHVLPESGVSFDTSGSLPVPPWLFITRSFVPSLRAHLTHHLFSPRPAPSPSAFSRLPVSALVSYNPLSTWQPEWPFWMRA